MASRLQSRAPIGILLAGLAVLVGAGGLLAWRVVHAPKDLGPICALAREGRFDRAQELLDRYLAGVPGDNRAHLLMAQLAMDRLDARPQLALNHLVQVRSSTPTE